MQEMQTGKTMGITFGEPRLPGLPETKQRVPSLPLKSMIRRTSSIFFVDAIPAPHANNHS